MTTTSTREPKVRKPKSGQEDQGPAPEYVSVKIRVDVYRKVKTVASWNGEKVGEYLSRVVDPIAEKDLDAINRRKG